MKTMETTSAYIKRTFHFGETITVMERADPDSVVARMYPEYLEYKEVYSGNAAIALRLVECGKYGTSHFERAEGNTVYSVYKEG